MLDGLWGKKKEEEQEKPAPRPFVVTFARGEASAPASKRARRYAITGNGRSKLQNLDVGDVFYQIMAVLDEDGECTVKEISEKTHISYIKVQNILEGKEGLVQAGFVRRTGGI